MVVLNHFMNKQKKKDSYYIRRSQELHEETAE